MISFKSMKSYIHATITSTLAWAGNIYDLLLITYVYSFLEKIFNLSFFDISLLFSLGLLGRVVGGIIFGRVADRKGRKFTLMIGTGGYSVFQAILAFSPNALTLFLSRFIEGIFMGAQWTAGTVLAYENSPVNLRSFIVSIVQAGYGLGYMLTGITYLIFLPYIDYDWRFFLLVGAFPLILLPYIKVKVQESPVSNYVNNRVRLMNYYRVILNASLAMSGMFVAYFAVFGNYTILAEDWAKMSPEMLGDLMTIANLFLTVSFIIFGKLASVMGVRKLIYIGIAGLGISLIFSVPLIPNILSMFIGTIFYAFFTGFWPLMPLLVAQSVPHEVRGLISGLTYNIGGFIGGLGNTIIGLIANVQSLHLWVDLLGYLFISVVFVSVITWPKYEIKN